MKPLDWRVYIQGCLHVAVVKSIELAERDPCYLEMFNSPRKHLERRGN